MKLERVQISQFRNILEAQIPCHTHLNVITGVTGAGKTSFLEALYLLSTGQSFRTRETLTLIAQGYDSFTIFAETEQNHRISIQKSLYSPTIGHLNGQACVARSELASFLPSQFVYQDIFEIIDAGPSVRRALLDWGLFHVEHNYHALWNDYRRVVKQRNSLLRQRASKQQISPWSLKLSELSSKIDALRQTYFETIKIAFEETNQKLSEMACELNYYRGWDRKNEGKSLEKILEESYARDCLSQYTHYGAHHADLSIVSKNHKVKQFLSRGQQKALLIALKLAQIKIINKSCIILLDDITSELDSNHISRLMNYLNTVDAQIYLSAREVDLAYLNLENHSHSKFICTQGRISCL